jgi:DNA invertase Pin-like site-specific DNA recombinase
MQRPEVRMIQQQETSSTTDISINSAEAYALMAKYNFKQTDVVPQNEPNIHDPNKNLTFEEMVAQEELKAKSERQRAEMKRLEELNRPHAVSFNDNNVNYHNTNYQTLDNGIGIQVQIVTDMNIDNGYNPKYYR